jgi:outer membrane protein assembly factor BamB
VDGRTIWTIPWQTEYDVNAADPIYRDGHLFVTSAYERGAMILAISPRRAKKLSETKDVTARFQPGILDGDHLYVNSEGTLKCLKWPTTKVIWETRGESNLLGMGGSILRASGDKMILLSQSGRLTLAKATPQGFEQISSIGDFVEGSEVWASPCIHNGKLYAKGSNELVCVDLRAKP